MHSLSELREGDRIMIEVTVGKERIGEKSVVCTLPSKNNVTIHSDLDIHSVTQFRLNIGDRVRWHDDGRWHDGKVLGINTDTTVTENPKTWVWVKPNDSWIHKTLNITDLKRA